MMARKSVLKYSSIYLFLFAFAIGLNGQHRVEVNEIVINGLKHTKRNVIIKELDFKQFDSIDVSNLSSILENNEKRLLSTGLFTICDINIKDWKEEENTLKIFIDLKENWYVYPAPVFELADRSFNVWTKEMNWSLSRVNYGLRLDHLNLTGNKDKFKIVMNTGYTRKLELDYQFPYMYKSWGMRINALYRDNKEIGYKNFENKVLFKKYEDERVLLRRFRLGMTFTHRTNVYTNQYVDIQYHHNRIDDVVVSELNNDYYPDNGNFIKYMKIEYVIRTDKTIFPTYPEGGYGYQFELRQEGFIGNYDNISAALTYQAYTKIKDKTILGFAIKGKANLTKNKIPYSNNSAIGYGADVIRGYELYVMDGTIFTWLKTAAKHRLFDKILKPKFMPIKAFRNLPIRMFAKVTAETGYAYEPTYLASNTFNNRMLFGYGPGIDLLILNNFAVSAEYNFNHTGKGGIFYKSAFNF